jgi:hypothetical protein
MTHEEACLQVQRAIRAETEVYETPPWLKKEEEETDKEKDEDARHEGCAHHQETRPSTCALSEKDSTRGHVPPTATAASTVQISEAEALALIEAHGVQAQVVDEKIQALSVWTETHAGGGRGSEWVDVVCRLDWLRAFLGD